MSTDFEREERYIVFKLSDLGNSLKGDEIRRLALGVVTTLAVVFNVL